MGPDSDPDVVVDSTLRVLEIKRLRVSHISFMPHVPSVNMTAEKAADLVKETWSAS
jgi:choline dehydrogenase-like flavoprotein